MPLFDFKCECGHEEQDKLVRTHDSKIECAKCGALMQKQVSATKNFLLMGEGFYKQHDRIPDNW